MNTCSFLATTVNKKKINVHLYQLSIAVLTGHFYALAYSNVALMPY